MYSNVIIVVKKYILPVMALTSYTYIYTKICETLIF